MGRMLWEPSKKRIDKSNLTQFLTHLNTKIGVQFSSYGELHQWSVEERATFWKSLWDFFEVIASREPNSVLDKGDDMLESTWFEGARLNFAENLLRRRDDSIAIVSKTENKPCQRITYSDLYNQVAALAHSLRAVGIKAGDRVAGFMPNMIETVVAMLATTSLGAVWSSTSPDFGLPAVHERFGQIRPRVLFTANGYSYNGKTYNSLDKVSDFVHQVSTIERVVVVPHSEKEVDLSGIPNSVLYCDFLSEKKPPQISFEQLPFNHPVYILYSSGTTGTPKCVVHGAGGTLLQHLKELALHTDIKEDDTVFYFTTTGWMMWNWLVSALAIGATIVLFDGSPFYPDPRVLFRLADEEHITVFGTSAKFLSSVEKEGLRPGNEHNLSTLKAILSTGSPLSAESYNFVYREIKEDIHLASISGGSDIISCFALGNPTAAVWEGELQCKGLGMKVDVFDEEGKSVRQRKGELVCTASFPSQPLYFWDDPSKGRYRSAYFETYTNVWRHGDFAEITEHDGLVIHGRSDATLNPGGVRIGTAEIYSVVETISEIDDSIAVGQDWEGDERVILFVRLAVGQELDEHLEKRIKGTIRANCSPRHVPAKIIPVSDIPYTISGKKVELAVKKIIEGKEVPSREALANPAALDHYKNVEELR